MMAGLTALPCLAAGLVSTTSAAPTIARNLQKRQFRQGKCSNQDWARFTQEESWGIEFATAVAGTSNLEKNPAFSQFIPAEHLTPEFATKFRDQYLLKYAGLSQATDIEVTIHCGNAQNLECVTPPKDAPPGMKSFAITDMYTNTMILCDLFFEQPASSASNVAEFCGEADRTLGEFETGGWTLIHEFGHLGYGFTPKLEDELYCEDGKQCVELAKHCAASAIINADTWMFAAMGVYWTDKCGRAIPLSR